MFDFNPDDYYAPHCNEQVLHAPGECEFCDKYPERQQARIASGTPFSPNEQRWPGNQAGGYYASPESFGVSPVDLFDHAAFVPSGWYCTRGEHTGPCALKPKWWNLKGRRRFT